MPIGGSSHLSLDALGNLGFYSPLRSYWASTERQLSSNGEPGASDAEEHGWMDKQQLRIEISNGTDPVEVALIGDIDMLTEAHVTDALLAFADHGIIVD